MTLKRQFVYDVPTGMTAVDDSDAVVLPSVDPEWYWRRYPDVKRLRMDPELHYHLYGHRLGRDPSPEFSTVFFRALLDLDRKRDPLRAVRALGSESSVSKTAIDPGRVLWAAWSLAKCGKLEQAAFLAERWLPAQHQYLTNVLRANLAIERSDEFAWTNATNAYLEHFGVAPIALSGAGSLFDRIEADAVEPVDGPKVTIIVAAWNSEQTVGKALSSLLAQSWRNIELLVVDDCSTDGTWDVINRIAAQDSRMRAWRNSENVGPYVSKSIAAAYATGDWITCHDADDWAHPERIERQFRFCTDNQLLACMSGMLRLSEAGEFTRLNPAGEFVFDGACRSAFISLFVSAQLFHDLLGAWDQMRAGGDSELLRRLERVTGRPVRQVNVPTMLCRDHEGSLTNHAQYGLAGRTETGVKSRAIYKNTYMAAHPALNKFRSRFSIPMLARKFDAPADLQVPLEAAVRVAGPHMERLRQEVEADVVIITNARFPGGNASSTLDELNYFKRAGVSVALVHCPVNNNLGREISPRYDAHRDILYQWSRVWRIDARVLICRHPSVLTSHAFAQMSPGIRADRAFVVKNNSVRRPSGEQVYDMQAMVDASRALAAGRVEFCPISQSMRAELLEFAERRGDGLLLSEMDWTPTFDADMYLREPKARIEPPYRIGRHARDGTEKWLEKPGELLQVYPSTDEFEIRILGGADQARKILGELPANWHVQAFGEVEPAEYLAGLDVFVYFPNSHLVEGFGRTLVEAMIAGVPVVVTRRLEGTFGELAFYCEPTEVAATIRRLSEDSPARVGFLEEVQKLALARYGTDVIASRLRTSGLDLPARFGSETSAGLSSAARRYRAAILDRTGDLRSAIR